MGFKLSEAVELEMGRANDRSALHALIRQLDAARTRAALALGETREVIECQCETCGVGFRVTMSLAEERQRGIPETCAECFEKSARDNPRPWHGEAPVTSVYREPQFAYSRGKRVE